MLRGLLFLFLLSANQAISGTVQPLPSLPNGATANAVQMDLSGNIYVAGWFAANPPPAPSIAFVGKLTPDGSQIIWWTVLDGSQDNNNVAIALGPDNSVYVTGTTLSRSFPTTPGSLQPTASVLGNQTFAAKLTPNGAVVYATYIGGSAQSSGNAITVDSAGHAFITGTLYSGGVFPTTASAVTGATGGYATGCIIELDPAGSTALVAIRGFGGHAITVDPQGNIYAAGSFTWPRPQHPEPFKSGSARLALSEF